MSTLDTEIQELEKQIAELKKKKLLEPVTVLIDRLTESTGRIHVVLSKMDYPIVDLFRRHPDRVYGSGDQTNSFSILTFAPVLDGLTRLIDERNSSTDTIQPKIELKWNQGVKEYYKEYITRPDLALSLDDTKGRVLVKLGPKMFGQRLYIGQDIQSFSYQNQSTYSLSITEAYKFPTLIERLYPQATITYTDELKELILKQVEERKLLAEVATAMDWPEIKNPFTGVDDNGIKYDLKPLQRVAVKMGELTKDKLIIAYPMGKGKTPISVAIKEIRGYKKNLVVCPAPAKTNWRREIEKFTGKKAFILQGAEPDGYMIDSIIKNPDGYEWFIINFDIMARALLEDKNGKDVTASVNKWSMVLKLAGFECMYIDEAHRIKNTNSKRSQAVMELSGIPHIISLTGTPIVNRPGELFPLLHLADPQAFADEATFNSQFMYSDGSAKDVQRLKEILARYMIRRTPEQFGDLHVETIPYIKELSPQARANYTKILEGVYISLRNPNYKRDVTSILAELTRCKQTVAADNCETSADLALEALEETDKKVLIFSQFKEPQSTIKSILGNCASIINGDVSDDRRFELVDEFQDSNSRLKVIVTNITEILTLTQAHTVVFNDYWWTAKDHMQAIGRCMNRENDKHGGNAYFLQNENTIDDFLVKLIAKKMALFKEVIDGVPQEQESQGSLAMELIEHLRASM